MATQRLDLSVRRAAGVNGGAGVRWLLLDRDGVLNADSRDHVRCAAQWRPLPGALQAVARCHRAGIRMAVVTNQSGVARGYFSPATLALIHARMFAEVRGQGGRIEAAFYCPHGPDDGCACRKPAPGLLLRAMRYLGARPDQTLMIGDSERDMQAARAAGLGHLRVGPGSACGDLAGAVARLFADRTAP